MRYACVSVLASVLLLPCPVSGKTIKLAFDGLLNNEQVLDYFNGGFGGSDSGPGPAWGIVFGPDALALIDADNGGTGHFANEPSPPAVVYFVSGPGVLMNVPGGFITGISFYYTAFAAGFVGVYDGPDGAGNLLALMSLAANWQDEGCVGDPAGVYCHWDRMVLAFAGIAYSAIFSGAANNIAFDDITLEYVPEPGSWALIASGLLALAGGAARRRGIKL